MGEGVDEEGFGEAGSSGDEAVAAAEEGDEHFIDDIELADDDFGELGADGFAGVGDAGDGFAFAIVFALFGWIRGEGDFGFFGRLGGFHGRCEVLGPRICVSGERG